MSDEKQNSEEEIDEQEAINQLYAFVVAEMEAGSDRNTVAGKLVEHGLDRPDAERMTNSIFDEITAIIEKERYTSSALVPGLLGGLIGAIVGGAVWAGIVVTTEYELGIVAWGIGGLCGWAVVKFAGGRKGIPLQVTAVATSVLGIVLGKYFTLYYFLRESFIQEGGEEAAAELPIVSVELIQYFVEVLPELLSLYDGLWVVLAVITAWKLPMASGLIVNSPQNQNPISPG